MHRRNQSRAGARHAPCVGLLCALLTACSSPAGRFVDAAAEHGFERQEIGTGAQRLLLVRAGARTPRAALHIYLDGDGRPFLSRRRVASDPTSRTHTVLHLMRADPVASVLVGRPCYYLENHACDPALWTSGRYSEAVVARMAAAINLEIARVPAARISLIGYSGGGALAMLIAPRLTRLDDLVTVAANLDVAAWARHHGYTSLSDSLDPALQPPLPAHIRQVHLFGAEDEVVPARLMRQVAERQPDARIEILAGYDHDCCWAGAWRQVLAAALGGEGAADAD